MTSTELDSRTMLEHAGRMPALTLDVADPSRKAYCASTNMPVVAVINRKGGSGKSTLATQLAGCLAKRGLPVMLGDVDRQQSSLAWLRRRGAQPAARNIVGWAFSTNSVM